MLYPTFTFEPADRDQDGYYMIGASHLHVFPFTVPFLGLQQIKIAHVMPGSQDWSIDYYVSDQPNGPAFFTEENATGHNRVSRMESTLNIWSSGADEGEQNYVDPSKTYYLMVRNLQNQNNGYKLLFSV